MTTTLSPAIRSPSLSFPWRSRVAPRTQTWGRAAIIAALLVATSALSGCGIALKLGYAQGSSLAFRWLDGYVDFNDAQSLRTRAGLDDFFAWHRRTQLPDYADLLSRARAEVVADTTPERMCEWTTEFRSRVDAAVARARPTIANVVVTLSPQQIANVEKKYAERNDEWRDDYLQKNPAKRRQAAIYREVERAEGFYGRLDAAQRERVARGVDDSPFDGELSYAERLRRQQDVIALLRRLNATPLAPPSRAEADAEIGAYIQRVDRSPREDYRGYSKRLIAHNCAFAAQLHNTTTPEQRRTAARKLKGYEDDLRSLAADAG